MASRRTSALALANRDVALILNSKPRVKQSWTNTVALVCGAVAGRLKGMTPIRELVGAVF